MFGDVCQNTRDVQFNPVRDIMPFAADEIVAAVPAHNESTRHFCRPVADLQDEMGCRGELQEIVL